MSDLILSKRVLVMLQSFKNQNFRNSSHSFKCRIAPGDWVGRGEPLKLSKLEDHPARSHIMASRHSENSKYCWTSFQLSDSVIEQLLLWGLVPCRQPRFLCRASLYCRQRWKPSGQLRKPLWDGYRINKSYIRNITVFIGSLLN